MDSTHQKHNSAERGNYMSELKISYDVVPTCGTGKLTRSGMTCCCTVRNKYDRVTIVKKDTSSSQESDEHTEL